MKKTYADQCLERAKKATKGPWRYNGIENPRIDAVISKNSYMHVDLLSPRNAEFSCHARTDVPELARRLNKAIDALKGVGNWAEALAHELEVPLEDKE